MACGFVCDAAIAMAGELNEPACAAAAADADDGPANDAADSGPSCLGRLCPLIVTTDDDGVADEVEAAA